MSKDVRKSPRKRKYIKQTRWAQFTHQFKKNKGAMAGLIVFTLIIIISITAGFIWDFDKDIAGMNAANRMLPPSGKHFLGTDSMGRDLLARICYGARYSLLISVTVVAISLIGGGLLGAIAGYFGGKIEYFIMRIVEIFMMIPGILLVIVFVSALGISLKNLIISIGLTTVPHFTRVMRASVLQVRNSDFVESARAIGCSDLKIIFRHIIPNSLSSSIVYAATRLGSAMTDAAAFSFLGLGVPSPLPEWGALLADGRLFLREAAYLVAFPGLAIMITVLSVNLIGDGVRDALDPKLKR